jgi:single-strand DNA-binding protein
MNHLNSTLIEGVLYNEASFTENDGEITCKFIIASNRWYKQGKIFEKEVAYIPVNATSKKFAEYYKRCAKKGRGVRVVGRLKQEQITDKGLIYNQLLVEAEHIEFRPEFNKSRTQENLTFNEVKK